MPCKGLIHPRTGAHVDWTYFDRGDDVGWRGGRPLVPPWLGRYLAASHAPGGVQDVVHGHVGLTATRTLGCPRATFLEVLGDWYVDPFVAWAMTRGTALHGVAAKYRPAGAFVERRAAGVLFNAPITATIDYTTPSPTTGATVAIDDDKYPNDWSTRYRAKDGIAKDDHTVQLNIARLLLAQDEHERVAGYDPALVAMTIWDHASAPGGATPEPMVVEHMDEATMSRVKPGGGDWTVREIVDAHERGRAMAVATGVVDANMRPVDGAVDAPIVAASLPLVGAAGMYGGKKCSLYCGVKRECDSLVARYGRPACYVA